MEDDQAPSLSRPESWSTNPRGHLWRDKWTTLSGPLAKQVEEMLREADVDGDGEREFFIDNLLVRIHIII